MENWSGLFDILPDFDCLYSSLHYRPFRLRCFLPCIETSAMRHISLIAVFTVAVLPISAESFRPLKTQSSRTLRSGEFEVDIAVEHRSSITFPFVLDANQPNRDESSAPRLELSVGLGENVEVQFRYDYLFIEEDSPGVGKESGSGDASFFTKWRFVKQKEWLPDVAIRMGAKLPNADNDARLGTDQTDVFFDLIVGRHYDRLSTSLNAGFGILGSPNTLAQDDVTTYGFAVIFKATDSIDIAGEVNGLTTSDDELNELATFQGAVRYRWKAFRFYVGATAGLVDRSEDWGAIAGLTWSRAGR